MFMGILLSKNRNGPTEDRVKAVVETREQKMHQRHTVSLDSYATAAGSSQFSTVSEPLRRLTKKNEPFVFGQEQKRAFKQLKESVAGAIR